MKDNFKIRIERKKERKKDIFEIRKKKERKKDNFKIRKKKERKITSK